MPTLFEPTEASEIVSRIQKLQPSSQAQWGKMNVAQMMAHCHAPFQMYFDQKKQRQGLLGILFAKRAKQKLFSDRPWPKSLPTAKEFKIADARDFENEKSRLLSMVNRFVEEGYTITSYTHPFFGKMSSQEWAILGYRHLNHHLRQFGV